MVKVETDASNWASTVNAGESSVSSISKISSIELSQTDLKPFTKVTEVIQQLNKSISVFKSYSSLESKKMIQASTNKQNDDTSYAGKNGFGQSLVK